MKNLTTIVKRAGRLRHLRWTALLLFSSIVIMPPAISKAALEYDKFYSITAFEGNSALWSIDPITGATNVVTTLYFQNGSPAPVPPDFRINALAFSPDNLLFGWNNIANQLYSIDYNTGFISGIGTPNLNPDTTWINGLAFDRSGKLYGLVDGYPSDNFYLINPGTGASTLLGDAGPNIYHTGLAINFSTDELYALSGCNWAWGCTYDTLYKLDKNTGQRLSSLNLTPAVNAGGVGVEFSPVTGELYTIRGGNRLMTVDIISGAETQKFVLDGVNTTSLAAPWPVVPEPASSILFIFGGAMLIVKLLRKRRTLTPAGR